MTIAGWIGFAIIAVIFGVGGVISYLESETNTGQLLSIFISLVLIVALLLGMLWFFNNTASGQRALVDEKSNFSNGLERTVTVYTANGDIIAQYEGQIDIEGNDGGYVLFDYDGKRYMYYNCFVESIAQIP